MAATCRKDWSKAVSSVATLRRTPSSRTTTWNCRRVGLRISCAPNNIATFAATPGWSKRLRVATESAACFKGTLCLKNRRRDCESGSILRWFRNAYEGIFRSFAQANGADWVSSHPLAYNEILRPLRTQRFYPVFRLQG